MTSLANHTSRSYVKLLLLGDAKTGKTGSLVSLVRAGFKLRILDFDNLLDILSSNVRRECPDKLDNIEFRSLRDNYVGSSTGMVIEGKPDAWKNSLAMLNKWAYTDENGDTIDLGSPTSWGPDCILVIDSLSRWCDAAYNYHESSIPVGQSGKYDGRALYGNAQDDVEKQLAGLTSPRFTANIIVICHGAYMEMPDGAKKIFPQAVGQKLSPKIPQYFPNFIRYRNISGRRTIQFESDNTIDLSLTNSAAFAGKELPIGDLARIFEILRAAPPKESAADSRPKAITLKRI